MRVAASVLELLPLTLFGRSTWPRLIMDAAHLLLKKAVPVLALGLLALAPGLKAQAPAFNTISDVTLAGTGGRQITVGGNLDPGTPITFTAAISSSTPPSGDPQNWLVIGSGAGPYTTPATLSLNLGNLGAVAGTYSAVVTLTPSTAGVAPMSFNVTYTSGTSGGGGGGGTGTMTASPAS